MSDVTLEIADGMALLSIDRPHVRNAIGLSTMADLDAALTRAEDADPAVLIVRGAGERAFISGGDLKELSEIRDEAGAVAMATRMRRLLDRLASFPTPVIAALNGHALGGGAEVAVAADIRVAADDIRIGFTQALLAIMPAWGGAERLAELVGRSRALLLIGSGKTLTAEEAQRLGLVDVVTKRNDFEAGWRDVASAFASLPPQASRSIKDVVAAAKPHVHPELERDAVQRFARLWVADEHWRAAERSVARRS
jgi:enoyl-CoA hydratase/carnithine racemase